MRVLHVIGQFLAIMVVLAALFVAGIVAIVVTLFGHIILVGASTATLVVILIHEWWKRLGETK